MKIAFSRGEILIDENITIKNQCSYAPTIQSKDWKTKIIPQVQTKLIENDPPSDD